MQLTPETPLESANFQNYEVCPSEPLHDLKGHLSSIIEAFTVRCYNSEGMLSHNLDRGEEERDRMTHSHIARGGEEERD